MQATEDNDIHQNAVIDRRMNGERTADARGQLLLFRGTVGTLKFRKPLLDLPVVSFEERDRILEQLFLRVVAMALSP